MDIITIDSESAAYCRGKFVRRFEVSQILEGDLPQDMPQLRIRFQDYCMLGAEVKGKKLDVYQKIGYFKRHPIMNNSEVGDVELTFLMYGHGYSYKELASEEINSMTDREVYILYRIHTLSLSRMYLSPRINNNIIRPTRLNRKYLLWSKTSGFMIEADAYELLSSYTSRFERMTDSCEGKLVVVDSNLRA